MMVDVGELKAKLLAKLTFDERIDEKGLEAVIEALEELTG